jgi:hypothetical protein
MIPIRKAVVASLAVSAALMFGGPAAGAGAQEVIPGPCASTIGPSGQGGTAGTENEVCIGSGVANIGPSSGQIATIVGPTISGPANIGAVVVAAGNGAAG